MRLLGIYRIKYKLLVLTGIHIGGTSEGLEIGGIDNPVIKDIYGIPYIPGSSLKGKIRSLLEISEKCINGEPCAKRTGGEPCDCGRCDICILFGSADAKQTYTISRLIFSDATFENFDKIMSIYETLTELKMENKINRITAKSGGLRKTERVPPGSVFSGEIRYLLIDQDGDFENDVVEEGGKYYPKRAKVLINGMKLLMNSYLGGSGTRGYGKVAFTDVELNKISVSDLFETDEEIKIEFNEKYLNDFKVSWGKKLEEEGMGYIVDKIRSLERSEEKESN